jgi:nucleotide-binding universal stress UspA family protein
MGAPSAIIESMYANILLAVDGSEYADWARETALQLLAPKGRINLLHVVDIVTLEGSFIRDLSGAIGVEPYLNLSPKLEQMLQEKGESILALHREACEKAGVDCLAELVTGVISVEIAKKALGNDVVVIGQRGANARFHAGLAGSVSEVLVRKAPRPIVVVPKAPEKIQRLLLGVDGSAPAARAMTEAKRICAEQNLALTVLAVGEDEEEATALLAEAQRYFEKADHPVTFTTRLGRANEELVQEATTHQLLVVGAHGHSRIVELVIGSTTEFLLRNTPIPVMFVR